MTAYISRDDSAALSHYGVMGMKWGVRKDPEKYFSKKASKIERNEAKYQKYMNKAQTVRTKNLSKRRAARAQRKLSKVAGRAAQQEAAAARAKAKGKFDKAVRLEAKAADAKLALHRTKNAALGNSTRTRRLEGKAAKFRAKESRIARRAYKKYNKASVKGWLKTANKSSISKAMKSVNRIVKSDEARTKRIIEQNSAWLY